MLIIINPGWLVIAQNKNKEYFFRNRFSRNLQVGELEAMLYDQYLEFQGLWLQRWGN